MTTSEERSDKRFYDHTIAALKDIEERALQLPLEQRYATAYGILRSYFEALLVNFAEAFTASQLAEIRIVLDQLSKVTGEDTHLDEATRAKLDQLAQALRESEQQEQRFRAIQAGVIWRVIDTEWRTTCKFHLELPQRKRTWPSLQSFMPGGAAATHDVFGIPWLMAALGANGSLV